MKDAFGGAFMIKVFFVFILIYISFTALALNYAKAFKVKNRIIEYIETNEDINFSNMTAQEIINMENFFDEEIHGKMRYNPNVNKSCPSEYVYCLNGIKIEEKGSGINTEGKYYKVSTYFGWNINFFNVINNLAGNNDKEVFGTWTISGETRLIINDN